MDKISVHSDWLENNYTFPVKNFKQLSVSFGNAGREISGLMKVFRSDESFKV